MATESTDGPDGYEAAADLDALREDGRAVTTVGGHSIALFHHEGEVYGVDNRCPHMGFPLSKGTVEDGLLTCHWHHARFELSCGDTFDIWADDVQTFPTAVREGTVYVDPDPETDVAPEVHWRNRLVDGMAENLSLVLAKSAIHLDGLGEGFATPLETAVDFGTKYRADGWGRGLTTLGAMANLYDEVDHDEKQRAMFVGVREVASNCAGEPPRFDQYALDNEDLSKDRLKSWFRETCEVRDADGAERCLRAATATLPPEDLAEILVAAATDHLYMNSSHTVDFINKAFETLDHVGWEKAPDVLAATVDTITDGSRAEETSSWRQPVDVAELCFDADGDIAELSAAGAGESWERPDDFVDRLLGDDPHAIDEALRDAVRNGATTEQLAHAVAVAALRRVAHFATSNEFGDWNTVHHTFSFANAVERLAGRTDADDLYRACWQGAMSVYLDRFLNQPKAPLPEVGAGEGDDPAELRERLLETFDEQGRVDEAGRIVSRHFDAGGDPDRLKRTMAEGLLREDAGFHTLQNVEGGFAQFESAESDRERRLALIAPARYMAAHFPTRREAEQTFTIAERLYRGENIHEAADD
ncbi:Rieske (2Fe-2S) protein [Halosimplex halophilum]|uniref:Rieske (2Fe-2S) protein n=1 Tax=Halosimplex halophilum TaxID=2559572 RepID=UPI00107F9205|nr:Rieske (2Fe-2S) protein [Halosimplex halophilum]